MVIRRLQSVTDSVKSINETQTHVLNNVTTIARTLQNQDTPEVVAAIPQLQPCIAVASSDTEERGKAVNRIPDSHVSHSSR